MIYIAVLAALAAGLAVGWLASGFRRNYPKMPKGHEPR